MKEPLLIMMVGLPGSGKSTVAQELVDLVRASGRECEVIGSDDYIEKVAAEMGKTYPDMFMEYVGPATRAMWAKAGRAAKRRASVVFDRTNHQRGARRRCLDVFGNSYVRVAAVMPTLVAQCRARNKARDRVPEYDFNRMVSELQRPRLNEGFSLVIDEDVHPPESLAQQFWQRIEMWIRYAT